MAEPTCYPRCRYLFLALCVLMTVCLAVYALSLDGQSGVAVRQLGSYIQAHTSTMTSAAGTVTTNHTADSDKVPGAETETSTSRLERLPNLCQQMPNMNATERAKLMDVVSRHMMVDDKHKVMYCYVPKAACSTWKLVMLRLASGLDAKIANGEIHDYSAQRRRGVSYLKDYSTEEQQARLQSYFKFTVVRDPFARLVSGYEDKFRKRERLFRGKFGRALRTEIEGSGGGGGLAYPADPDIVTFEEFVSYVTTVDPRTYNNGHWGSMVRMCQPCLINYDYLGKVETMDRDAQDIANMAGEPDVYSSIPRLNSHKRSMPFWQYYRNVSTRHLDILSTMYQWDTLLFGYSRSVK